MLSYVKIPAQILSFLLGLTITPSEVAAGVCLAMFLGFVPVDGPFALFLFTIFFFLRVNKLTTLLTLPLFKLLYHLWFIDLTDMVGEYVLVKADFLNEFWMWFTTLPIIALLDVNNTLVAGGIIVSAVLSLPVFILSRKIYVVYVEKYVKTFLKLKIVSRLTHNAYINKLILSLEKIRSRTE